MTIKMKILIPMIILNIIVVAAVLCSNILQFSGYVDTTMEDRVNAAANVASNKLEMLKTQANTASLYVAGNPLIAELIENGNRNALLNLISQLESETGVDFCTITDSAGIVLVRTHDPENFGDNLSETDYISYALSGRSFTTVAESSDVAFSIRSGTPVFNSQGNIIGVVSAGFRLDTTVFVDSIKGLLGCEVTLFLGDERISTTVVKDDGTRAVGTKAAENVSKTVLAGNTYSGLAKILNRDALTKYSPIFASDGTVLGMLFVGRYMTEKTATVWAFVQMGLLITLVLLVISVPVVLFIVRRIVKPINAMVKAAHALASGDTGISVQVNTRDEMRKLADAFNEMTNNTQKQVQTIEAIAAGDLTVSVEVRSDKDVMNHALVSMVNHNNEVFSQIVTSSDQVSSGSRRIADSSQALAQGATEQSATVEQLLAAIGEVDVKTSDSAAMAEQAATLSKKIKNSAEKGSHQMDRMVEAVKEITYASQSINKIIKVIDDIAYQTNILALNASVEAARAGQHGKGFAVVSDEVRNLAAKSAEAAKETGTLIENSMAKSELGAHIADETAASLGDIVSGINESSRIVEEIAKSARRQSTAITQLNDGINQVAQVVQQNSSIAQESAAASEEMNGQAELLQDLVSRFKLKSASDTGNPPLLPQSRQQDSSNTTLSLTSKSRGRRY